jgi:hypothetical protein
MPIAKSSTNTQTKTDDAPRASVTHETETVVAAQNREPVVAEVVELDASLDDPYDNMACTD